MVRPVKPDDFRLIRTFSEPRFSPDGKRIAFSVRQANMDDDGYDSDVYVAAAGMRGAAKFTTGGRDSNPVWSPDGAHIAFVSKRNFSKDEKGAALYVIGSGGGEARQVFRSKEAVENVDWSRDSGAVLFLTSVGEEGKDDVRVIRRSPFWFNGVGFTYYKRKQLMSVDLKGSPPKQLTTGEIDVVDFAPSHDGRRVAYLASTDDLKPYIVDLFVTELASGTTRKLSKSNAEISAVAWSPDDKQIAVVGSNLSSGFASNSHVWVTSVSQPKLVKADEVDRNKSNGLNSDARSSAHGPNRLVWDGDGIYFVQLDGPSARVYRMKPGKAPEVVVGGERSVEAYDVSKGRVAFVAMDSSHLQELFFREKKKETQVTAFNSGALEELDVVAPVPAGFTASDGQAIDGWALLPRSPTEKVPAVLYVHGGPKTGFGNSYMHEFQTFVGAGYAVLYFNPRGSDGYSEAFADIRGKYGTRDFQDLMEGLDSALKAFPQLDPASLAIAGGSYGGFMANWAVGHTDRFKAAVADRSIASWVSMWGTSDIGPYFTRDQIGGDPWNGMDRLLSGSPLAYVQNVKTPVLLVHSMEDFRCWMVEGIQFFTALKQSGKEAELVLFPGESHDLSRTGKPKHRASRLDHYLRWLDSHLKQAAPAQS